MLHPFLDGAWWTLRPLNRHTCRPRGSTIYLAALGMILDLASGIEVEGRGVSSAGTWLGGGGGGPPLGTVCLSPTGNAVIWIQPNLLHMSRLDEVSLHSWQMPPQRTLLQCSEKRNEPASQ